MEPISRIEHILCGEEIVPISRLELFLEKAMGFNVITPTPLSRIEKLLNGDSLVPDPNNRNELFIAKFMGQNVTTPSILSRFEYFISSAQRSNEVNQ